MTVHGWSVTTSTTPMPDISRLLERDAIVRDAKVDEIT